MDTNIEYATGIRLTVGGMAPSVEVLDGQGQVVSLPGPWLGKPLLLTFLRHFG